MIEYSDFLKLDMRVGVVISCEDIQGSENLYKLMVDCGGGKHRQIISGIKKYYSPDQLIDTKIVVLINLKSKKFMGIKSEGILLAADINNEPVLLRLNEGEKNKVPAGTKIK